MAKSLNYKVTTVFFLIWLLLNITGDAFADREMLIIGATEWAPYTSEDLAGGGFLTEICTTALARAGYGSKVKFVPWKRAVKMTKKGVFQCLIGASYTEERAAFFLYPDYSWKTSVHFFAKKGHKFKYEKIKDLCFTRLGILMGSFYVDRFKKYKCFTIDTVPNVHQNIRKLSAGRLDLFIDTADSVQFYITNNMPELTGRIEPLLPPLETDKIYLVISKKVKSHKEIQKKFDAGIRLMQADGTYDELLKKHGKQ